MQIYEVKVWFYYSVLCHVQCLRCRRDDVKAKLVVESRNYLWTLPLLHRAAVCVCVIRISMTQSVSNVHFSLCGLNQCGLKYVLII